MISVVIPLYNKRDSIRSTIESVLAQTYTDFEIVVVDDGSTDGSAEVVKQINDARIRLVRKSNGGVSSARNEGVRQAKYNHIAFLDADDLYERGFLAEIAGMIEDFPNAGIWGTSYYYLNNNEKIPAKKPLPEKFYGLIPENDWSLGHLYCSSAVCCLKKAIMESGMFDERISYGEDIDVWWGCMLRYPAAYSNKPLATYRFDESNRLMTQKIPLEKLHIRYFEKYDYFRSLNPAFRAFIDRECVWWLTNYLTDKKYREDIRRIISMIDLTRYKKSFRWRFNHPYLYSIITKVRHGK